MSDEPETGRRVRFYGRNDLATGWFIPRAMEIIDRFQPGEIPADIVDAIELYNVQRYVEHEAFPLAYTKAERDQAASRLPQLRGAIGRFFSTVNQSNFEESVQGVDFDYHSDLLDLLSQHKVFERCDGATVVPALLDSGVHLGEMLANRNLVKAYGAEIRDELCASPTGAEHLIRKYFLEGIQEEINLPTSLGRPDARELLERYVDTDGANPNYIDLVANAKTGGDSPVDAKLKLKAKRRRTELVAKFFEENEGVRSGCEVTLSQTQDDPVVFEMSDVAEGLVARYSYSTKWLDETADNASVLNNFHYLFEYVDEQCIMTLPSYEANLGVMERIIGTPGKTEYRTGAGFRAMDTSSLLQLRLYAHYLETKGTDIEQVISWYFEHQLVEEFALENFSFAPSDPGGSYLQRVRHLFAEMESVASQFALFVAEGELDRDLLSIGSDQVRFREIPSLLAGKYVYSTGGNEIATILHLLFSDQSGLCYINERLQGSSAVRLLLDNDISYADLHDYQKERVDKLVELGVIVDDGTRLRFDKLEQVYVLRAIFYSEAASYFRLSSVERAEVDAMVEKGWLVRESSLLTKSEGAYFNYYLNAVDFSNGPELRNKYLHGAQANAEGETAHFYAYLVALRLTLAMVIKLNDDVCLSDGESKVAQTDG